MRALALALCLVAVAGCADQQSTFAPVSAQGDPNLLMPSGATWAITELDGRPLAVQPKLKRAGSAVQGTVGCAAFQGGFATQGAGLALPGVAESGVAPNCTGPAGSEAAQILAALRATDGVSAVSDGSLKLTSGGNARITLWRVFKPRPGAAARIDTTQDAPPVPSR